MLAVLVLVGVIRWSNTVTLGSAVIGVVLGIITLGSLILLVRRKGLIDGLKDDIARARGVADDWKAERDAAAAKADRLVQELADEKVRARDALATLEIEQQEIRHGLKAELEAARKLGEEWRRRGDQTPVVEGLTQILERLTTAEQTGINTVAALLESMDERASKRDAAIIDTQRQIVTQLERLTDRVTEKVGEVVQEKLDQNGHTTKEEP